MQPISPTGIDAISRRLFDEPTVPTPGFTLVELLLVVALVGVLSAVLAPILMPSAARTLEQSSTQIGVALRESRRLARAEQQPRRFVVDTGAMRYQSSGTSTWRVLPEGMTIKLTTAESLLSSDREGAIEFQPDGSSSGGRIMLGLHGRTREIDVEWLTGRIRIMETTP